MARLKITVNNGGYEDVEMVAGVLQQGQQITVHQPQGDTGRERVLFVNSLITDDQPDLAICTLIAERDVTEQAAQAVAPPAPETPVAAPAG